MEVLFMGLYVNQFSKKEDEIYEAIAYYRLSKDDGKNHESDSIANQRVLIREYVKTHPNIKLVDEAFDDGYTGTNYDRPGFGKVMEAVNSGAVNCVIVKDYCAIIGLNQKDLENQGILA